MTGVSMLVTGWVASRIGPRQTLLVGLALVVVFSARWPALRRASSQIAGFRLGWGLGNALFIATALSVIVGAASGGLASAIVLFEAALGLGIASGPLLGGLLGGISWRGPFFGTATLMAIGFVLIATLLGPVPKPAHEVASRIARCARCATPAALDGDRRRPLQLRLLHDPRLHAVPARARHPPARAHLLRLGPAAGADLGVRAQRLERRFGLVPMLGVDARGWSRSTCCRRCVLHDQTGLIASS